MELTTIIDPTTGDLTIEGWTPEQAALLADLLPDPVEVNCAMPATGVVPDLKPTPGAVMMRLARVYHGSVVDGPGIRSVIQMQGCYFACPNCYVPETHAFDGGIETSTDSAVEAAVATDSPLDGLTILGGEPFAQEDALLSLLEQARMLDLHTCVYTGWKIETLRRRAQKHPGGTIDRILQCIDLLIDGRYIAALGDNAGEWRGSRNQRVIENPSTWHPDAR